MTVNRLKRGSIGPERGQHDEEMVERTLVWSTVGTDFGRHRVDNLGSWRDQ